MAHPEQQLFVAHCKRFLPEWFRNRTVLEIGSLDVNGSVREFFEDCRYTGIDVGPGKGVDVVAAGQSFAGPTHGYDVVISCEAMEHDPYWRETLHNAVRMLKPDGLMLLTCATYGRRQHGTPERSPGDSPLTAGAGSAYYRNLGEADCRQAGPFGEWFGWHRFFADHVIRDLYFVGLRPGAGMYEAAARAGADEFDHYLRLRNDFGAW